MPQPYERKSTDRPNFLYLLGSPYENESFPIRLALEIAPQYLKQSKLWQETPRGEFLITDSDTGNGVIVNSQGPEWAITGRFDRYVPTNPKKYPAAIAVSIHALVPSNSANTLGIIANKLTNKGESVSDMGRLYIMEVRPSPPQHPEIERLKKLLQRTNMVNFDYTLISDPQTPYGNSASTEMQQILSNNILLLTSSRLKRPAKNPEQSTMERIFQGTLTAIKKRYELLGFRIANEQELRRQLATVNNFWVWNERLKLGINIVLEEHCGCKWDMGNNELASPACPIHMEEKPLSPKEISEMIPAQVIEGSPKKYRPLNQIFNLSEKLRTTNYPCGFDGCSLPLEEDSRLVSVTNKGYVLRVDYACPHDHGLRFTDLVLTDGTPKNLVSKKVLSRQFPYTYY